MKILPIRLENTKRKLNFVKTKKNNSTAGNLILPNGLYFTGFVSNGEALEYKKIKTALFQQKPQINGVGFYGPDSIGKDKAFNDFVNDLRSHDYEISMGNFTIKTDMIFNNGKLSKIGKNYLEAEGYGGYEKLIELPN